MRARDYIVGVDLVRKGRKVASACCTITFEGPRQRMEATEAATIVTYGWKPDDFGEMFTDSKQETVLPLPTDIIRVYSVYEEGRVS